MYFVRTMQSRFYWNSPRYKKIPTQRWGLKERIVPSGLSGAGLVFGVFYLKPIVAYTKANPFAATKEVSDPLDMGALCSAEVIKHIILLLTSI
jgi:hypothetical protein